MPKSRPKPAPAGLSALLLPKPGARKTGFAPATLKVGKAPKTPRLTPGRWASPGKSGQR